MHLRTGDLLLYEARMAMPLSPPALPCEGAEAGVVGVDANHACEQIVCFTKLPHDLITRPVRGAPRDEIPGSWPGTATASTTAGGKRGMAEAVGVGWGRGRPLRPVRWAVGQEGISFARPGCRSVLGHFVAHKAVVGATVHGIVHLPQASVEPGKGGNILRGLLRRGHYAALVSRKTDALVEEVEADVEGEGEGAMAEDEEEDQRHRVQHKNWTSADPALGGPPPLLMNSYEVRLLALSNGFGDNRGAGGGGSGSAPGTGGGSGEGMGGDLAVSTVESHPLERDEYGLTVRLLMLDDGGVDRPYVAVGTGFCDPRGEDKAARGRLILFEVDYAFLAKEDGGHKHAVKLRECYAKEQKGPVAGEVGPVSAIAQLGRHIILSVGKKIIVNRWDAKGRTMELIGFHDTRVYVVTLSTIKQRFVLVGDVYNSVQLVVWREEDHSLTALAKDYEKTEVLSAEYLVDEPGMGIVVADADKNIKVLQYVPNAPESRGGNKLLCQSDFFLGSGVAHLSRHRTRGPRNGRGGIRYCLLAGTLDGGLGVVCPVEEKVFRRLYALQGIMSNALAHTGAANPRAHRLFDSGPAFRQENKKNMLDGTLLWRFVGLDVRMQHDLTRAIGTTVDRVMGNLLDIDLASLF
ncbi:unnamed protein product [Discosporangium mesarthrocarpum]